MELCNIEYLYRNGWYLWIIFERWNFFKVFAEIYRNKVILKLQMKVLSRI